MEPAEARASEEAEGQILVTLADGGAHRVLLPAGIGVPGVEDTDFALALVLLLLDRGTDPPATLDASAVIARDPGVLAAVEAILADADADADADG